jgi:hypothetical protein
MLSFSCVSGTKLSGFYSGGLQDTYQQYPVVYSSNGKSYLIPEEVEEVGKIILTSPIHFYTAEYCLNYFFLISHPKKLDFIHLDDRKWPEETGGNDSHNKLREIMHLY